MTCSCDCDCGKSTEPPTLASFSVEAWEENGKLWVTWEDMLNGGTGNDPIEQFESVLRHSAESTQRLTQFENELEADNV
jgi:hypothetical protein|tara:strand:+ start:1146 stop:1382 length:237 start_codon:yes stop_codon:yes gene_type:complete